MKSAAICRNWLKSLPPTQGNLQKEQDFGRERLFDIGIPSPQDEAWRLSNLNRLNEFFSLPLTIKERSNPQFPDQEKSIKRLILNANNGILENIDLPEGITKLSNREIEENIGNIIKTCNIKNDLSVSMNQAASSNLLALKINNKTTQSLEIIVPSVHQQMLSTRVILILEEGAKLDLLEVILGNTQSAQNHLIEIKLEANAELNHELISLGQGTQASSLSTFAVEQGPQSKYSLISLHQGWHYARFEPRITQIQGDASTTIKSLQVTRAKEQIATHSLVRFEGPNGKIDQLQKAVATDSSHSIFNGSIAVPKQAQKTEAAQLSRNLILSKRARIDTKPELEIVADDVRCTHGATVSQLQDEELFYLLSRGIDRKIANSLLLKGYYDDIVSHFSQNAQKWDFIDKIIKATHK